ncbi:MAG: leucine-rich repeat protein [Bacteroidetes bacterium]|nr:leucine-rich repeat protein [Bacteroidota bacterium]
MKTLLIAGLMILAATKISAQQVINFYASEPPYNVLTKADVDAILEAEWDGGDFVAEISSEITVIDEYAFIAEDIWSYYQYVNPINLYMVEVNATNVKLILREAFFGCKNLISVSFPLVEQIDVFVFAWCESLTSVDFPIIDFMYWGVFINCKNLTSVSFGTGFKVPTTIYTGNFVFGSREGYEEYYVYGPTLTPNIDLILGVYVLPECDTILNTWKEYAIPLPSWEYVDYIWKSITIKRVGITEKKHNFLIDAYPNPTTDFITLKFEMESNSNIKIILCDVLGIELMNIYNGYVAEGSFIKTINVEHLNKDAYFFAILTDKSYIIKKILIN